MWAHQILPVAQHLSGESRPVQKDKNAHKREGGYLKRGASARAFQTSTRQKLHAPLTIDDYRFAHYR
jgi:hypothetical protein